MRKKIEKAVLVSATILTVKIVSIVLEERRKQKEQQFVPGPGWNLRIG